MSTCVEGHWLRLHRMSWCNLTIARGSSCVLGIAKPVGQQWRMCHVCHGVTGN